MEKPSDLVCWVVARRTAMGGINYRTAEIGFSDRDAVMNAAFGVPALKSSNKAFPAEGVFRVRIVVEEFRPLEPGEKNVIDGED